jgi:putative multiple sugar transport system substrate-binding protein
MPTKLSERWITDGIYINKHFLALGYRTDLNYAENDVKTQVSQIENMIADGVDCLVISPIDCGSLTEVVSKAHAAKIPVISYDRLIMNTPYVDYYATFDNYRVGVLQGNFFVDKLGLRKGKGPFHIELFGGSPDDNNAYFFYSCSMSVLKPYIKSGKLIVKSGQTRMSQISTLRWDGASAQSRMEDLLGEYYKTTRVDAILSPYDGISIGIITALSKAGYGTSRQPWPIITGQDAEIASINAIIDGEQSMTVFKDTRKLAKVAVEMANAVLLGRAPKVNDTKSYNNGKKIVPAYLLTPVVVTKENYVKNLISSGYYTRNQLK